MADLHALAPADLAPLEGFAGTAARNLVAAIGAATRPPFDRFLFALGIRHVGSRTARLLARRFADLEALQSADESDIAAIPGIGPTVARSVAAFLGAARNREILETLRRHGVRPRPVGTGDGAQPLDVLTFVFTGKLERRSCAEAEAAVARLGARATGSVSAATDYVVVGADPGAKRAEARERGIEVLDEAAFERLLEDPG